MGAGRHGAGASAGHSRQHICVHRVLRDRGYGLGVAGNASGTLDERAKDQQQASVISDRAMRSSPLGCL